MANKPDSTEREPAAPEKKKGKFKLLGVVGGVMIVEGVAIFLLTRMVGGGAVPAEATVHGLAGEGGHGEQAPEPTMDQELVIATFRAINDRSGQNVLYDVKVYARVAGDDVDKAKKIFEAKKASIEDRLAKVVRSADPAYFKEPGLETLRRQIRHELESVIGDEHLLQEVLIPSLMWYNADV